jgi:hypothetical protein
MRNAKLIAAAVFVVHAAVAWRYGFFRDELYFIACGRHPAFGYVDQPPLVPLLSAATQLFGDHLWALRFIPALAHALTVVAAASLAEIYEEKAALPAALAVALAPMYMGLHTTLNTTCFDPLIWTLFAYCLARGGSKCLIHAGLLAGLDLEIKYAFPFFAAPILAGYLLGPDRKNLLTKAALIGAILAAVIAIPSLIWQWQHGFPFLTLTRMAADKNEYTPPVSFLINQIMVMNPLLGPLWIGGLVYGLLDKRARFLAIGFLGLLIEMILVHGKDYYVAPAYGVAFALGGAAVARWLSAKAAKVSWFGAAAAISIIALPGDIPVLDPESLPAYLSRMHIQSDSQEKSTRGTLIPQHLADMLAWPEFEEKVAAVWKSLPQDERTNAAIFTGNYGEAGAVDFFGARHNLPPARSGHNSYGVWGRSLPDANTLVVAGRLDSWQPRCKDIEIKAYGGVELSVPIEKGRPIFICHLRKPLSALWAELEFIY